jgi:LuxR family transcriptional regulator, quorum-sensing system regulator BjaR1
VIRNKMTIKPPTEKLTGREVEVMTLTAYGKMRSEISDILLISEETVKAYMIRACRKLNAVNKTHAITIAITLGLITPYKNTELNESKAPHARRIKNRK